MTRYRNRPFPVPRSGSGFLHITPTAEVDFSNRRQLNVTAIKEGACFTSLAERNLLLAGPVYPSLNICIRYRMDAIRRWEA